MRFQDIPGLAAIKDKLVQAVANDHVAHAQLFAGAEGSANLALALAFATFLNCENRTENDACGVCASCVKNEKLVHPDLHFVFPTAATPKIKREDAISDKFLKEWRGFLLKSPYGNVVDWNLHFGWENKQVMIPRMESRSIISKLTLKAFEGQYKVMLIWQPELMNINAANGILKILEEPPEKTLFLMVANDANRLLSTILSRTQLVKVPAFEDEDVVDALCKTKGIGKEEAEKIAYSAEGNLRMAFSLADGVSDELQGAFKEWMRVCYNWDFQALLRMMETFQKGGKEYQKAFLLTGTKVLRDTLMGHFDVKDLIRVPAGEMDFIQKFGKVFTEEKVAAVAPQLEEACYHIERNGNPKITFIDLSLSIAKIARAKEAMM